VDALGRLPDVSETEAHLRQQQELFRAGIDCALGIWLRSTGAFVGGTGLHPRLAYLSGNANARRPQGPVRDAHGDTFRAGV
jgi:hypothetical protein